MKLFHQTLLLVFFPLLLSNDIYLFQINGLLERLNNSIQQRLETKAEVIRDDLQRQLQSDSGVAKSLATSREIAEAIEIGDSDLLFNRARLFVNNHISYITFVNTKGIVIARGHDELHFGDSIHDNPVVKEVLSGINRTFIGYFDNDLYMLSFYPVVKRDREQVGILCVGQTLDAALNLPAQQNEVSLALIESNNIVAASKNNVSGVDEDVISVDFVTGSQRDFQLTIREDNSLERGRIIDIRNNILRILCVS